MASPVMKFKVGSVEVAVWENIGDKGMKNFSFGPPTKSYKGKDGSWKTTTNIKSGEAFNAIMCYQKAFEWVYLKNNNETQVQESEEI